MAANRLVNVQKRLALLYPGSHELKMATEQEMFIILLDIYLDDVSVESFEEEKIFLPKIKLSDVQTRS